MSAHAEWEARCMAGHHKEVARGLHDEECEYGTRLNLSRLMLCHCHKRKREQAGLTEPPTDDLYFPPPDCPRCGEDLVHDGDCWVCSPCALSWASNGDGRSCTFTDEYGDLEQDSASPASPEPKGGEHA